MVAEIADRVVVMGEGRVVEEQTVFGLFAEPGEDYTRTLLAAVPRLPPVSSRGEEPAPVAEVDAVSPGGAEAELATEATGDDQTTVRQEDHAGEVVASDDESADLTDDSDDDVPTEPSDRSVHRILRRVVVRGPAVVAEKGGGRGESEYRDVLRIDDLAVVYPGRHGAAPFPALQDISLTLGEREVLGLVGESGSGKSTLGAHRARARSRHLGTRRAARCRAGRIVAQ